MRYTSRDLRAIDLFALMLLGIGLLFLVMGSLVLIQGGHIVVSRAPLRSKPVVKLSAFGYTNEPQVIPALSGTVSGDATFTLILKNFGDGVAEAVSGQLQITHNSGTGGIVCTGGCTVNFGPVELANLVTETIFIDVMYTGLADGSKVTRNSDQS